MLNIDYSSKRKFLMSIGLTLLLLGSLLYFATLVFSIEKAEDIEYLILKYPESTFKEDFKEIARTIKVTYMTLWISGAFSFLGGLILWRKNDFKDEF